MERSSHRLPQSMKIRLYASAVCSTFTHACESWDMTPVVCKKINGFNSRCLHIITGEHWRETATNPLYNLLLAVRKRRLRFLGHVLRMDNDSLLRRTLLAYTQGGEKIPEGSLLADCSNMSLLQLEAAAQDRTKWRTMVYGLR